MASKPLNLIVETSTDVKPLVESRQGKSTPSYFIEGIFMQGNMKNQNERIYPVPVLEREVRRYTTECIAKKRAFGETNHPPSPTVNLDRVSHIITKLVRDGDNFLGKAKVMEKMPMGKIIMALIDEEAQLGVSTRGLGSLRETENGFEVQDDFFLSAVDIVADPSAPDAFVRGIMEGKAWVWESGQLKECVLDSMAKAVDAAHKPTVSSEVRRATLVESFDTFLGSLSQSFSSKHTRR